MLSAVPGEVFRGRRLRLQWQSWGQLQGDSPGPHWPLPQRAQEYGFRAGLAFLACLFVFATWNDLTHLGLFRWVASLIG